MKKSFLFLLFSMLCLSAHAEVENDAIAITLGFTQNITRLNSPNPANDASKLEPTAANGFKFGFMYDATFYHGLGLAAGINYNYGGKTTKWETYPLEIGVEQKERIESHIVEAHLDLQYKAEIAMDTWLIFYTGPTIQGIAKYYDNEYYRFKIDQKEYIARFNYNRSDLEQYYHSVNVTWGIGAGFQYKRIFLRGGYDFGLMNPYKISDFNKAKIDGWDWPFGYSRKTRGRWDQWQIKVGFYIWQRD